MERTLGDLGMGGVFYAVSDLAAPWGIEMPPLPGTMMFHLVIRGRMVIKLADVAAEVVPGMVLIIPHGQGHAIADTHGTPLTPLFSLPRSEVGERYERITVSGPGEVTELVCGGVSFSGLTTSRLVSTLPPLLEIGHGLDPGWIDAAFALMAAETRDSRPGADAITARIADVLVIQAIRAWVRDHPASTGWVAALRDPRIGAVLDDIHDNPAGPWTLIRLADRAHLSRSAFAARFTHLLGEPPMAYVTSWRMDLAAQLLRGRDLSLARVAERVGYRSEASFNRAFKRAHGVTPGAYARRGTAFVENVDLTTITG